MSDKRHFEWAILRRVIDLIQVNAKGADLGPVLDDRERIAGRPGQTHRGGMSGAAGPEGVETPAAPAGRLEPLIGRPHLTPTCSRGFLFAPRQGDQ
jgi:hypothetical protein